MKHLAIILDGNRRWARAQGLPTLEGHHRGYERVKEIGLAALGRGIKHLTVFAFSTENWKRSQEEVGYLMDLLLTALTKDLDFYMNHNVRLRVIGRREGLSDKVQAAIAEAEDRTKNNTAGQFNLCINYGGRAELVDAVKEIMAQGINPEQVTEEQISSHIWMKDIPDPDLIIRTSGEQRTSGFLTWSGTYSEILFVDKPWPDFTVEDLDAALANYQDRDRRYGGNSTK